MQLRAPLATWLLFSYLVILALPLVLLVGTGALSDDLKAQTTEDLQHQAALLRLLVSSQLEDVRQTRPDATLADLTERLSPALADAKETTLAGVRVVDLDGIVIATSGEELGENLSDRAEVLAALAGRIGLMERPRERQSPRQPLNTPSRRATVRLFVAEPVIVDGEVVGAIVLSRTPREEIQALYLMIPRSALAFAFGFTLLLALFSGWLGSRSLNRLSESATRVSRGDMVALDALAKPVGSHIVEVGTLADAFSRMAGRLSQRLRYISEFASNVAHEFRTPITTVRGTLELLRDDPDMPREQQQRFFDNSLHDLARLDRLIGGLLELARAEEVQERVPVQLSDIVQHVAAEFPGVVITEVPRVVLAHRVQLETVLRNLLANARRYGGPNVKIFGVEGGFDVVDDGPGISQQNLAKVFDRFFTTGRSDGGTGLGLALVRVIVEAHGGSIDVQSVPGETRFRVRLPAAPPPQR